MVNFFNNFKNKKINYTFNLYPKGVFYEQLADDKVTIERRIFAHQYYNRLLITQILVQRKQNFRGRN